MRGQPQVGERYRIVARLPRDQHAAIGIDQCAGEQRAWFEFGPAKAAGGRRGDRSNTDIH